MDWHEATVWIGAALFAILGWLLRTLWSAVDSLRRSLSDLEVSLPNVYARRDDVRDMFNQVLHAVNRVHDELSRKADK